MTANKLLQLYRVWGPSFSPYEDKIIRQYTRNIAIPFAHALDMKPIRLNILSEEERDTMLQENYDEVNRLNIPESTWDTFLEGDLIARVKARRGSAEFYIAAEASFTGAPEDIERATNHAKILRCATSHDAYAIVAAIRLSPAIRDKVTDNVEAYIAANN